MALTKNKNHIVQVARTAFERETGVNLKLEWDGPEQPMLCLKTAGNQVNLKALVLAGDGLATNAMLILLRRQRDLGHHVVVFQQATADRAEALRKDHIQFIDMAGNGYINQPPVYLFVKGNKVKKDDKTPATRRVFKQTGLRVLYALLCQPELVNETYRVIAHKTGVALGMVNWVVKDLEELGFLLNTGMTGRTRQLRLIQKERLLERWVIGYAEQLRPKLVLGHYRGHAGWWEKTELAPQVGLWGGEVAAAKLTNYLKPALVTIYVDRDKKADVVLPNRLIKDPNGDIELVARFWQPETIAPDGDMVHPLLVYADLMATGNQRNLETARMIYDQHLAQLVRED